MQDRTTPAEAGYYEQLETGARWLASQAREPAERDVHLGHAVRYARLKTGSVGRR